MSINRFFAGFILVILFTVTVQNSFAQDKKFSSPYNDSVELSRYFTRSDGQRALPCEFLPDGQIHWCNGRLPGVDFKKVMANAQGVQLYNPCPEGGYAWSDPGGDPFNLGSGGSQFVAIECAGAKKGWQSIFFHVAQVLIPQNGQMNAVFVGPQEIVAIEGDHTHWSLGYWGDWQSVGCEQFASQGRWFVNPAKCDVIVEAAVKIVSPATKPTTVQLTLKGLILPAIALVIFMLTLVVRLYWTGVKHEIIRPSIKLHVAASVLTAIVVAMGFSFLFAVVSWMPIARKNGVITSAVSPTFATNENVKRLAQAAGYKDPALLQAFIDRCVSRRSDGSPSKDGEFGKIFPCWTAAAVPLGETNSEVWSNPDPRQPGPWGRSNAWNSATSRWPSSYWDTLVGRLSPEAQACRDGLKAIAVDPAVQNKWPGIKATDIYSSSACAVGRGQTLAMYFAESRPLNYLWSKDVWSDPHIAAEVIYWHLTSRGCTGSWWNTESTESALCGYNPGAWGNPQQAWYFKTLRDGAGRLEQSYLALGVETTALQQGDKPTTKYVTPSTAVVGTYQVWETIPSLGYRWSREATKFWDGNRNWYGHGAEVISSNLAKFFFWWGTSVYSPQSEIQLGFQVQGVSK